MRLLLTILVLAGLTGFEMLDRYFPSMGTIFGGVYTLIVLLGLSAYFKARSRKKHQLTPEIRDVFNRMITGKSNPTTQEILVAKNKFLKVAEARSVSNANKRLNIEDGIKQLMNEDAAMRARGEIPETRLVPHHAIKRDIIITAYTKDFKIAEKHIAGLSWSEEAKHKKALEIKRDFDQKIYGLKRLSWEELDKIILLMKKTRSDLKEIEEISRSKDILYNYVDPIFT